MFKKKHNDKQNGHNPDAAFQFSITRGKLLGLYYYMSGKNVFPGSIQNFVNNGYISTFEVNIMTDKSNTDIGNRRPFLEGQKDIT